LVAQCDSGGLHVAIFGHFVESGGQPLTAEDGQKHSGEPFSVEATIPWETLKLKGLRLGAGSWKFGHRAAPSKLDTPHRSRDPRKLEDLLIYTVTPIVAGNIWFPPEIWPKHLHRRAPTGFLMIDFEESFGGGNISFSDARAVTVLEDGFVYGGGASNCCVTLRILRRSMLEWEFGQRDSIAMQLAGDALGSVRYWTGYGQEASDPLGCIEQ
jgi:hypothetical protein